MRLIVRVVTLSFGIDKPADRPKRLLQSAVMTFGVKCISLNLFILVQ